MRIGIDSYSYHRLLGELRTGEEEPGNHLGNGGTAVVAEARALGVDGVSLQTCFLDPPVTLDLEALRSAAGPIELVLAWGAPNGLELGASEVARADLFDWIDVAASLGCRTLRIVVAGPSLRDRVAAELPNAVSSLKLAATRANSVGVDLALENHGDLTAVEVSDLLARVNEPALHVCFDSANTIRVGDDPVEAVRLLAPAVRLVHLKDCEPLDTVSDPVAGPRSLPYGTGVIPIESVLEVLADAGFDGLVCVELGQLGPGVDERKLVADCVRWLRRHARQWSAA